MHLPTLLTTLTLLTLTTSTPIAKDEEKRTPADSAKLVNFKPIFSLRDNKDGGCNLKFHDIFECKATVTVDKKHKCADLPKGKIYKGDTCGKGHWKVDTRDAVVVYFDDGIGSTVACDRESTKGLVC